jgi:signal transduction histidine kinase
MDDSGQDVGHRAPESSPPKTSWRTRLMDPEGSLRGRLIGFAAIWFIIALAVVSVFLTSFFSYASMTRFQSGIDLLTKNLYTDARFDETGRMYTPPLYDPRLSNTYSGLYWQINEVDAKGKITGTYRSLSLLDKDLTPPGKLDTSGNPQHYDGKGPLGEPLRQVAQYLIFKDHNLVFIAGEDSSKLGQDVTTFALVTGTALILMAAFSLLAIYIQVRFGLKPLFALTDEIAHVRTGAISRLSLKYPKEIKPVAEQINAFLDYNQEVVERQRTHVGNLAHALKTPLSVLLTSAHDDSDLSKAVVKQTALMREHVDRHLRRARAAARSQTLGETTPVEAVLDELAVMFEQVFHDKGVIIDWRAPEDLSFRGEKQDLQEILGNLIENACIWSRSKVRLNAAPGETPQTLKLTVEDDGPGLEEARYAEVLQRGARLDESAPGSGLGLAIVDELVRAYDGNLRFYRAGSGGFGVELTLPRSLGDVPVRA